MLIDISQERFGCHVYPGDKPPSFERVQNLEDGDACNLTNLALGAHNGTHVDAPKHFVRGGKAIDEMDLSLFYGKCTVAALEGVIDAEKLAPVLAHCHERLLLKGPCEVSDSGATALVNSHVKLIGVEGQSIAGTSGPASVHVTLLANEVIPLEGLALSHVAEGEYVLAAFPLNLAGSDGAPVRAVLVM
jgi:arylformamidase